MYKNVSEIIFNILINKLRQIEGLIAGELIIVLLWVFAKSNFPYYIALFLIIFWFLIWYLISGRYILIVSKNEIIFCFNTDDKSRAYYKKVLKKLIDHLDSYNLNIKIRDIAPDIINSTKKAIKYRKKYDIGLIVWGYAFSETKNGKDIIHFKPHYTCRINKTLREKLELFLADLSLIIGKKDWNISLDNTLPEEAKIVNNFIEVSIFIIGIHSYTDYKLNEAIRLFNILKVMIPNMQEEPFKKFIQGRINSLIIETNLKLGDIEYENKRYDKARKCYLEIDKYKINKFKIYLKLGVIEYFFNNLEDAKDYIKKAKKINKNHPVIYIDSAFFATLDKNYESALYWYKKVMNLIASVDLAVIPLLEFLFDRYKENKNELAYLFAIGIINYKFADREKGLSDLSNFIKKTKKLQKYSSMTKYSKELLCKQKYQRAKKDKKGRLKRERRKRK
ncbi:hypothetical protein ES695_13115 [Candidatus Atribacteria bacterium 1244-E10-H5-B2]|nr:MAG: hypothetical protein ES695_13115 [Candidatus Atribacteria bacterium 1244-E10-H5-B2]